jgi:hypothetical protein
MFVLIEKDMFLLKLFHRESFLAGDLNRLTSSGVLIGALRDFVGGLRNIFAVEISTATRRHFESSPRVFCPIFRILCGTRRAYL